MEAAVLAVLSGVGYQESAREFGVSVSTLFRRVKNHFLSIVLENLQRSQDLRKNLSENLFVILDR